MNGGGTQAEDCFIEALRIAPEQEALFWDLRITLSLSPAGSRGAARQTLPPVYERFTDGFETTDLRSSRAFLDAWAAAAK